MYSGVLSDAGRRDVDVGKMVGAEGKFEALFDGRAGCAVTAWLAAREPSWLSAVERVALDPTARERQVLAYHRSDGLSNRACESANALIKKTKRVSG